MRNLSNHIATGQAYGAHRKHTDCDSEKYRAAANVHAASFSYSQTNIGAHIRIAIFLERGKLGTRNNICQYDIGNRAEWHISRPQLVAACACGF